MEGMRLALCVAAVAWGIALAAAIVVLWLHAPWWAAAIGTVTAGAPSVFLFAWVAPMLRRPRE